MAQTRKRTSILKLAEKQAGNLLLRLLYRIIRSGPPGITSSLGGALGRLYHALIRRHRTVAHRNLRLVFPAMPEADVRALARRVFINFGKSGMEFLRVPIMTPEEIDRRVRWEGVAYLDDALAQGKGVLLITAHFGNWELMAAKLAREGYCVDAIARNSDLPATTEIVNSIRESHGMRIFDRNSLLPAVRALKENRILAILPDQHDTDGIFVDFLGYPARTAKGPAAIALRTGAVLIPGFSFRQPDDTILVRFYPPVPAVSTGRKDEDTAVLTQTLTRSIADRIREAPDQWLWFHNRWKSTPNLPWRE